MIEALLCDMDGTLIHSNWLHAEAWRDAFAVVGIDVNVEEVRRQIGKGADTLLPAFMPWWLIEAIEEPLKAYRKYIFEQDYLQQVRPFPGVRDLLLRLKKEGIHTSLASSADKDSIEVFKRIAHMEDLIDEEASADDATKSKPHPDIFIATLKKLGVKPGRALALGDTPYDVEAAGKAGLGTIGVTTGGWTKKDLLYAGCVAAYTDVEELLLNFDSSPIMRF